MSFLDSLFGTSQKAKPLDTPLELVTYAAGLVSNQAAIGPTLDIVRSITARLSAGQVPPPEDENKLIDVYLELESYLTTKEPLRNFTTEDLRKRATPELLTRIQGRQTQPPTTKTI